MVFSANRFGRVTRNLLVYLFGVGLAVAGALGLVDAITLPLFLAVFLLLGGLALVILVHEKFNGPL